MSIKARSFSSISALFALLLSSHAGAFELVYGATLENDSGARGVTPVQFCAGGGFVHNDLRHRVHLEDARRVHRGDGALDGLSHGFLFLRTKGEKKDLAGLHDAADAHGDAVHGDLAEIVLKEAGVIGAGPLRQSLDPRARGERGGRLVETDVSIAADPEQLQVDPAGRADRVVCGFEP